MRPRALRPFLSKCGQLALRCASRRAASAASSLLKRASRSARRIASNSFLVGARRISSAAAIFSGVRASCWMIGVNPASASFTAALVAAVTRASISGVIALERFTSFALESSRLFVLFGWLLIVVLLLSRLLTGYTKRRIIQFLVTSFHQFQFC